MMHFVLPVGDSGYQRRTFGFAACKLLRL
jgi:hypothetical protein